MAGVLETLTVPRASLFPNVSSPVSQLSLRQNFSPESKSSKLNINSFRSSESVRLRSKFGRRAGRIVCEAQEAAVQGFTGGNAPKVTLINISTNQKSRFERFPALEVKASSDGTKTSSSSKSLYCESCEGNGKIQCSQCQGTGVNTEDHFNGRFKAGGLCWLCRGKKDILCGGCNGAGYVGGIMSTADD